MAIVSFGQKANLPLPPLLKHEVTDMTALLAYRPLATVGRISEAFGCKVTGIPLSYYREHSF